MDQIPQYLFINRSDEPHKKNFNTLPGEEVALGSVVYWNGSHWLVVQSMQDDEMTYRGAIQQCNRELVWQNRQTREIISRWCTIEKPYYSNLDRGVEFTFSTREFKVQLPYDEESCLLDVDRKFMLDIIDGEPKVYSCTSVDMNTDRFDVNGTSVGFISLNLTQSQYNPEKDSIEYGICDYLPPFDFLHPTEEGYLVLEATSEDISPGGFPVHISTSYFNFTDGTPRDGDNTIFSYHCSKELKELLTTTRTADGLDISLAYSPYIIGETLRIDAVNEQGTIGNTIELKVVNPF